MAFVTIFEYLVAYFFAIYQHNIDIDLSIIVLCTRIQKNGLTNPPDYRVIFSKTLAKE